ncbi:hypothetical protein [Comamonas humi]
MLKRNTGDEKQRPASGASHAAFAPEGAGHLQRQAMAHKNHPETQGNRELSQYLAALATDWVFAQGFLDHNCRPQQGIHNLFIASIGPHGCLRSSLWITPAQARMADQTTFLVIHNPKIHD